MSELSSWIETVNSPCSGKLDPAQPHLTNYATDQHAHLDIPRDTYTGTVIYDEGNTWIHSERVDDV